MTTVFPMAMSWMYLNAGREVLQFETEDMIGDSHSDVPHEEGQGEEGVNVVVCIDVGEVVKTG